MTKPPAIIQDVHNAAAILQRGEILAVPTETVYGLAGDATRDKVVAKIYTAKGRPEFNPLIVHTSSLAAAEMLAEFTPLARRLAEKFWPGPLSLVLPLRAGAGIARLVTANLPTIALRVPAHPVIQQLLRQLPFPLAAPSANPSGRISPTSAQHVQDYFTVHNVAAILDGGPCQYGLESAIIDASGPVPRLLRLGSIARQELSAIAPNLTDAAGDGKITAPGMLLKHYAPRLRLRIGCDNANPGEALLAFGPDVPLGFAAVLNLSPTGDLTEAAANLYRHLHALDRPEKFSGIATMILPQTGLGEAITDRLRRAAAGSGG